MKTVTMLAAILDHVLDAIERGKADIKPVILMAPKVPRPKKLVAAGPKLTPTQSKAVKAYVLKRDTAAGPQERIYEDGWSYGSDHELGIKYWPELRALTGLQRRIQHYIQIEKEGEKP